ncbi:MAG: GntR family transcriptional regulator [Aquidulcibacter sp.]|jgi:DNA-binding GntR family transcriptional regulator|uniref:GntR family transcriptional regulator n=1 Tax=Aquidulcibacter sp. TaxID=2052990 RepID=UPI0022BF871B|nr:GntR family transcriptional regulator [Rhodocyclaceae bacterium]MCZ8281214.1 GntR family transcriptional regulator [Aquidulcibacter sp.]
MSDTDDDRSPPSLARKIRWMIQSGEALPGSHLGTVELAERFGVSRGPLREALRLLESSGLVKIVPQRGAFVIRPDDCEVQDLLSVREVLFALLAERCAKAATPTSIMALRRELEELEEIARCPETTPRRFQVATYRYVAQMNVIVGSGRLAQSIRDLSIGAAELYGYMAIATRDMRLKDLKGYQKLFKLIANGDASAAFLHARAMHSQGVARAMELSKSALGHGHVSTVTDFVQRKRRKTLSEP